MFGKYCSHAYAHASKSATSTLPPILKGSDMLAYEVFRSLGIEVLVRPVVEHISKYMHEEDLENRPEPHTQCYVGEGLTEPINTLMGWGDAYSIEEIYEAYPSTLMKVTWMNKPTEGTENLQFGFARVSLYSATCSLMLTSISC
jgi:hypothetical protein